MTLSDRYTKATANMLNARQLRSEALARSNEVYTATEKAIAQLIDLLKPARAEAEAAAEEATNKYFEAEAEYVKASDALKGQDND